MTNLRGGKVNIETKESIYYQPVLKKKKERNVRARRKKLFLLEFQDAVGESIRQDATYKVKVTNIDAAVRTTG